MDDQTMTAIRTLLEENHDHPYVTFNIGVHAGSLIDPPGKEGLAYLASNLLTRGTTTRTYAQIAEETDVLGSMLDVSVGKEATIVRSDALKRNLGGVLGIVADVVLRPSFPQEELDKLRRQTMAELKDLRNHDEYLARHYFHLLLYDGHLYGRPGRGTLASLPNVTRDDVVAFAEEHFRRGKLFVASSGAITRGELADALERHFGSVPDGPHEEAPFAEMPPLQGRTLLLVDKPERTQTQVVLGHLTVDANDPDYFPLLVANTVFGGTFTARLSQEIREKRGWSYGAYSYFSPSRRAGSFSLRFYPNNEHTAPAIELAFELLEKLAADGITEEELEFGTSYLINQFPFKIDTTPKRIEHQMWGYLVGWPEDFLGRYIENVRAVTLEGVRDALRRHIHPADVVITVVGTGAAVRDELARLPDVRRVIEHPYDREWDLDPGGPPRR